MSLTHLFDVVLGAATAFLQPLLPVPAAPAPPGTAVLGDAELLAESTTLAETEAAAAAGGETIEIVGDAPAESASSVRLTAEQLRYRSRTQPSDILRQVPGLQVSQHAGGGKADQYFIRGFDADHGTDVAIFADGIPVNLTSHGHGQGYADSHWMIPETVASVDVHKGPYAARFGDFYTAGALELATIDEVDGPTVWIAAGGSITGKQRFDSVDRRVVGMASPQLRDGDRSLIALQIGETDGAFLNPQDFRQGNALVKWAGRVGAGELALATTWYRGAWNQSGQLPEGEIAAGRLDRFGAIDPTEGGVASRASVQLGYTVKDPDAGSTWRVMGYGVSNDLQLFSNFTLYARDPINGDQIEQTDDRLMVGLDAAHERRLSIGGAPALVTAGVQARGDDVETSLRHAAQRERLASCFGAQAGACNHTQNAIRSVSAYVEANVMPAAWLTVQPGVRIDRTSWTVDDLAGAPIDATTGEPLDGATMTTAGSASAAIANPKLSVQLRADDQVSFFFNAGSGFHSNDARAAVTSDGEGALVRALGGEAGVRMKPAPRARVSADIWYLRLASEQVWSGDAGGTEASDPTRRFGLDMEGSVDATPWLKLDANVTWSKASFVANRGNGGGLALAPRWMGSGGATVHDGGRFVSLRARGIGDRAGNDEGTLTAEGYVLVDVVAGARRGAVELNLTVNNALDTAWREAQFAEASRVMPTGDITEQMHFTPGAPLSATLTAAYHW